MKHALVCDAAEQLETTVNVIWVTACNYRKKHGEYPCWYLSNGRNSKIDIEYLFELRDREMKMSQEAIELYYFLCDDMNIHNAEIARKLIKQSELYNKHSSWLSFMNITLFSEPMIKFHDRVTRLSEFHRIATNIKAEHEAKLNPAK